MRNVAFGNDSSKKGFHLLLEMKIWQFSIILKDNFQKKVVTTHLNESCVEQIVCVAALSIMASIHLGSFVQ